MRTPQDREEETPETVDLTAPLTDKATDSDCEELLADKVLPTADEETAPESIATDVVEVLCPEILTAASVFNHEIANASIFTSTISSNPIG